MQELTDILRDMRLSGGVFLEAEFTAPWCIVAQVDADDCEPFIPMPPYLIAYHYVLEGRFILDIEGGPRLEAGPGQLVVLPRNDRHCLASAVGVTPVDASGLITPGTDGALASIRCGGGGERTRILCGFLGSADGCDPLLLSLPPVMSLRLERHGTGKWIEESMRFAMHELQGSGPGAGETLARLAELLFAQAVREYVQQLPLDGRGWLHGLRDPVVGKALALLHAELDRGWTLDDLARRSAVSRSVLTDRFARLIGLSPMEYHRRRRLDRAAQWLTRTTRSIASIAFDTGYGSEEAFSRSFKRAFGASPGSFRKGTQTQ
jgi:AraC-like DNA-binding protein